VDGDPVAEDGGAEEEGVAAAIGREVAPVLAQEAQDPLFLLLQEDVLHVFRRLDVFPGQEPSEERAEVAAAGDCREVVDVAQEPFRPAPVPGFRQALKDPQGESGAADATAGKADTDPVVGFREIRGLPPLPQKDALAFEKDSGIGLPEVRIPWVNRRRGLRRLWIAHDFESPAYCSPSAIVATAWIRAVNAKAAKAIMP
jgi:hypothetical protein